MDDTEKKLIDHYGLPTLLAERIAELPDLREAANYLRQILNHVGVHVGEPYLRSLDLHPVVTVDRWELDRERVGDLFAALDRRDGDRYLPVDYGWAPARSAAPRMSDGTEMTPEWEKQFRAMVEENDER